MSLLQCHKKCPLLLHPRKAFSFQDKYSLPAQCPYKIFIKIIGLQINKIQTLLIPASAFCILMLRIKRVAILFMIQSLPGGIVINLP
ncbi:hypothetical protein D9M68_648800 [compost metagenome]